MAVERSLSDRFALAPLPLNSVVDTHTRTHSHKRTHLLTASVMLVGSLLLANGRGICAVSPDQSDRKKRELVAQEENRKRKKEWSGENTIYGETLTPANSGPAGSLFKGWGLHSFICFFHQGSSSLMQQKHLMIARKQQGHLVWSQTDLSPLCDITTSWFPLVLYILVHSVKALQCNFFFFHISKFTDRKTYGSALLPFLREKNKTKQKTRGCYYLITTPRFFYKIIQYF